MDTIPTVGAAMNADLQSLGVGGILLVLVLKMVFDFLKDQRDAKSKKTEEHKCFTPKDRAKLDNLYDWHDRSDADGVKVWYVRASLEVSIAELSEALKGMTRNQDAQLHALERLGSDVREVGRRARTEDGM